MNKKWDDKEKQFIRDNCHVFNDEELARQLTNTFGRLFTKDSCRKMRQRMGLIKEAHRGYFKMKNKE